MGTLAVAGQKATAGFNNQYYGFADTTFTAVTAATQTVLTTSYSIPANEAAVGSAYEIRFGGSGQWGSTQQTLTFSVTIGSVVIFANIVIGANSFAASANFRFSGHAAIVWNTIGASGNVLGSYLISITETANAVVPPGTYSQGNWAAQGSYTLADANGAVSAAIDSTAAQAFVVKCAWGNTTGAPTITNRQTIWKKTA
jgi:hypothetical protein